MLTRSARATSPDRAVADFTVAADSPVSAASCTFSPVASISRASAPTASPSLSRRMSPGTRSADGSSVGRPSRSTEELAAVIVASAATASSALASCTKPRTALRVRIAAMTTASIGTPSAPSIAHAVRETAIATRRR